MRDIFSTNMVLSCSLFIYRPPWLIQDHISMSKKILYYPLCLYSDIDIGIGIGIGTDPLPGVVFQH